MSARAAKKKPEGRTKRESDTEVLHIRLVLLKWFCRMASQGRVLLFGVTGGGFKAGIRSCHAVHAPETLPVLCMG